MEISRFATIDDSATTSHFIRAKDQSIIAAGAALAPSA